MGPRSSIVAGLVVGIAAALVLMAAVVAFAPDPSAPTEPPPTIAIASASPTAALPSALAGPSATTAPPSSGGASLFHVGELAPVLVVPQVGGGTIDLASLKGKSVWINFMQTTCEPCVTEFPQMNGFAARYSEAGLVIIAIDIREEEGAVASFAQSLNATFPLGLDAHGAAQRTWGAFALPTHFWIDRTGIVRDGALGGIGPDIMARGVAKILPGVEVTP